MMSTSRSLLLSLCCCRFLVWQEPESDLLQSHTQILPYEDPLLSRKLYALVSEDGHAFPLERYVLICSVTPL